MVPYYVLDAGGDNADKYQETIAYLKLIVKNDR
jgi:hypothetical protein